MNASDTGLPFALTDPQRGCGLSVVRLLIEAMGDRLQVAAHPRGGSDTQWLLPIARTQQLDGATRANT
jgi:hypothetical protein